MRRGSLFSRAAALLITVGLVAACSGSAVNPGSTQQQTADVPIGMSLPLSPPGAVVLGQQVQRGADLGIVYVNTVMGGVLGGRKVALHTEDDRGQNDAGVAAYRRLVSEKNSVVTFGWVHSSVALAVSEVAKEIGVPVITTGSAVDITAKHYPVTFRPHVSDVSKVKSWLPLFKEKGYKKVALLAEDTDYGIGLVNEVRTRSAANNLGITFQTNVVDRTAVDLTPQLLKIKSEKPDLLINMTTVPQMHKVIDQAAQIGLFPAIPMLHAGPEPTQSDFWQLHPSNGVGLMMSAYYSPLQPLSDAGKWLVTEYRKKFNEDAEYFALDGFAMAIIAAQAIDQSKSTDPKKVVETLETGTFKGWTEQPVSMPKADGMDWHNWSPPIQVIQYTKAGEDWRQAPIIGSTK
jgi:branched-chain amino acid transport system substrate-binding protein